MYAAKAAVFRPPGAPLPVALLGAALGDALTAGLTAGVVDELAAVFELPLQAATNIATHAVPAVMASTCFTRRTPISYSLPMPTLTRSESLWCRAQRDQRNHQHPPPPKVAAAPSLTVWAA